MSTSTINWEAESQKYDLNQDGYIEVPLGTYDVSINNIELKLSKAGKPMVSVLFKINDGDYIHSCLFMNQVVTNGIQKHIIIEFLRSLEIYDEESINFPGSDYTVLASILTDLNYILSTENIAFQLKYGEDKGYKTFTIEKVFR